MNRISAAIDFQPLRRAARSWAISLLWLLVAPACLTLCGCGRDEIETAYGRRSALYGGDSVNGTAVLADMFVAAGHKVDTRRALSPNLETAQTIVWFPDDFAPPSDDVRTWLSRWLSEKPNRTLVFVGRDFDAAPQYWKKIEPLAPIDQQAEIRIRKREAEQVASARRAALKDSEDGPWFTLKNDDPPRQVRKLQGPWSNGVDAAKVEIELHSRLDPDEDADILLESDQETLASVTYGSWDESQLIVVANGSFLLNLPLVNREHRKLAARLIDDVGAPGRVVFLESGRGGPPINPDEASPSGLEILGIWPLGFIFPQLAALGLIFCFSRLPIFGKPGRLDLETPSDFGKHVTAFGQLLRRTRDRRYADGRLTQYREQKADKQPKTAQ